MLFLDGIHAAFLHFTNNQLTLTQEVLLLSDETSYIHCVYPQS
jgi:hypothetical protein